MKFSEFNLNLNMTQKLEFTCQALEGISPAVSLCLEWLLQGLVDEQFPKEHHMSLG